jgi:predicted membrane-bound dolichyl-phosphate-mannose-protein mannosyltransferase
LPIKWAGLDEENNSSSLHILYTMVQFTRVFALLAVIATGLAVSVKRSGVVTVGADLTIMANLTLTLVETMKAFELTPTLPKCVVCIIPA